MYSKESLETLRQKIDLPEVIGSYISLHRSGASYKGLCPFHEEKTPSFMIQKGDSHYHCFGCGAHGDAISFLMEYVKMSFVEALESLAERFRVSLEKVEDEEKGPNKKRLKSLLEKASAFFRFFLLHSEEGREPLEYLYQRGIDLTFIEQFEIGYAPKQGDMLYKLLRKEGFTEEELQSVGLLHIGSSGRKKDFFLERITFPIKDRMGAVIGFSARKFKETTFGGKYVNTPETPLFKKSQVLFGFCYSRGRIAKDRKALIVEGQIDALRLIHSGFDYTVAGQGTAFGEGHVKELLSLGIHEVFLAFDGDLAGQEAAIKVGDLFQSKGVEVTVLPLPKGSDPDSFLLKEGKEAFSKLFTQSLDYLSFYYQFLSSSCDMTSPSKKNEMIETIARKIRAWQHPVLVHESLKKLSSLAGIPSEILAMDAPKVSLYVNRSQSSMPVIDPDRVLEMDLLRWLYLSPDPQSFSLQVICKNLSEADFKIPACAHLFTTFLSLSFEERRQWLTLASHVKEGLEQEILSELLQKKVNKQKIDQYVLETIHKLLTRNWMERKSKILEQIKQSSEEDSVLLLQKFNELNKQPPQVVN